MEHNTVQVVAVHKKAHWHVGAYNAVEVVVDAVDLEVAYKGRHVKELEEGVYEFHEEDPRLIAV